MRGSVEAQQKYAEATSITERPMAVLELNANSGIGWQYAGYYYNSFTKVTGSTDPTSVGTAIPSIFSTYSGGTQVTGAAFATGVRRYYRPVQDGTDSTSIEQLQYVDEPDKNFEEHFSIVNVLKPHRPDPGIVKMCGNDVGLMYPGYARYYPSDAKADFKYWRSYNLNEANPFVVYSKNFFTNKLKITLQNYAGLPLNYQVQVLAPDNNWTTVWTQASGGWPTNGIFKIYYYDNAWTTVPKTEKIHNLSDPSLVNGVLIKGVRLKVTAMAGWSSVAHTALGASNPKIPLEVVEMSARFALDITDAVQSFDTDSSLAEDDSALPVGTITANDGALTVENYERLMSFDTVGTPLYGWEPKRSVIDLYFSTALDDNDLEINRMMYGIIKDAVPSEDGTIEFSLSDSTTVLQDSRVKGFVTLNKSLTSIILLLLDIAGVSGFQAHFSTGSSPVSGDLSNAENLMIKYYYATDQNVYEALADLAEAYQFALVYDADNVLNMYSKEWIMKSAGVTPVATLAYVDEDGTLANIKSMNKSNGKIINDVSVRYTNHFIDKRVTQDTLGMPLWEATLVDRETVVWEADEEILSVAPLVGTLNATAGISAIGELVVDQEGGEAMDFSGYLQIEEEVIAYDAKYYQFKLDGGSYQVKEIRSMEEYNYYRDRIANNSRMFFTGKLRIPKGGRGQFDSVAKAHTVETARTWPYSSIYASYKWCSDMTDGERGDWKNNEGDYRWDYKGGAVYNVRGTSANAGEPKRNGAESLIRMTNAKETEFYNYSTVNNIVKASAHAGHGYLTWTPLKTNNTRPIPRRIGAGIRILGKKDSYALGVLGAGGVGIYMRYNNTTKKMSGWVLEVRPTIEKPTENVVLYEIINSAWTVRKKATVPISVHAPDVNTSVDTTDQTWVHVDLAYFEKYGIGDAFVGYVNNRKVLAYKPTTTVSTSSLYGPIVRGDSMMDVDYTWWTDKSDPNNVDGYSAANDIDEGLIDLEEATEGAGGPPAWWDSDSYNNVFRKKESSTQTDTFGIQEFGPLCHSVIVRDATFGDTPVLNARVAHGASGEYNVPEYEIGAFDAKLVIVNARRRAVNISGAQTSLAIVGYKIEKNEEEYTLDEHIRSGAEGYTVLESKARASRAIHGYSPLEISTDLIQDAKVAYSLLNWIVDYCTLDCEVVNTEVFGNPLLEVGDKVRVLYDDLGYTASQMFIITAIAQKWGNGLTTQLTLRRIK